MGLVLVPSGLATAVLMPLGGRLTNRLGSRLPMLVGAALMGPSFVLLARLGPDTSLVAIAAILALRQSGYFLLYFVWKTKIRTLLIAY